MPEVKSTGGYGGTFAQHLYRGRRTTHSSKTYLLLIILLKNEYSLDRTTPTFSVRWWRQRLPNCTGALTLTAFPLFNNITQEGVKPRPHLNPSCTSAYGRNPLQDTRRAHTYNLSFSIISLKNEYSLGLT